MSSNPISMVQECVDEYLVNDKSDGSIDIVIKISKRFKNLWLIKLSELRTSEQEIKEYEE
jgi:hypothetical protein